ncbi:MAG: hypothetical protein MUO52_14960, partial [Desulfobacterales bacterium]|nr:hypothetical protein [Desulfobacterales bacterium]
RPNQVPSGQGSGPFDRLKALSKVEGHQSLNRSTEYVVAGFTSASNGLKDEAGDLGNSPLRSRCSALNF